MREFVEIEFYTGRRKKRIGHLFTLIGNIMELLEWGDDDYLIYFKTYIPFDNERIDDDNDLHCKLDCFHITKESYEKLKSILEYKENQLTTNCNQLKENTSCPSYDCGYCATYPTPYEEKCKNITDCIWKKENKKKQTSRRTQCSKP